MSVLMTTTEGMAIDWEELLEWHRRREKLFSIGSRLQLFHRAQMRQIMLRLTQSDKNVWTWGSAIKEAKEKMSNQKFDSHCVVCKRPAFAPKGNFNATKVTLCDRPKCIRQRRAELQRERRKQRELFARPTIVDEARKARRKAKIQIS